MIHLASALAALLLATPLPAPKPAQTPPATRPFLGPYKEAGVPVVRVHSWYDWTCCSDRDCAPIKADEVTATDRGWFVRRTGETLPYTGDVRVKKSQDDDFHICVLPHESHKVRCLYVPPMGF